ncbi:MAG: DNA polymerase [Candidatus Paceibacterota bacterium]
MSSKKKKETLILLDTHAIIHRAYHAIPEMTSPSGEPVNAVYGLAAMLIKIIKDLKPDHVVAAYDLPGPTHRHEVYKEYKAKRPQIDDSLITQINRSRDVLSAFSIPIYEMPGFEADDVIGTIAVSAKKNFDVIIASGDMDTLQLVDDERVRVFTLRKGIQDTILYDEKAVLARYGFLPVRIPDYKGFAGDPSDNIIGIPGVGEKTATKLLQEFDSMEGVYKAVHNKKWTEEKWKEVGISARNLNLLRDHEDEAEFSKVLATIRTDAPIAFKEPEKSFADTLDVLHATSLFTDLGFRSLVPRMSALSSKPQKNTKTGAGEEGDAPRQQSLSSIETVPDAEKKLFAEAKIMLWLTQSDITNPTLDDVLANTKSKTVPEAHAKLTALIEKEELKEVFENIEKPLIPVIEAINAHGVLVDKEYLASLSKEYHAELDVLAKKICDAAGEEFNINSPKQLGEILFTKLGIGIAGKRQKKTATGQLSTRESELVKLKGEHPIIEHILSYRELQKLLSTYIDAIPPLLASDNRLHTSFIQTGTTTGRISSHNPNLQNIPVKSELGRRIRRGFIAPKGFVLAAFDYSQIELRLAAFLSGDEKLIDIFKRGEDVHSAVAAEVYGVPQKEVTYDMRRSAKVINFGILYGMGVNALRENLGGDRAQAQEFYNRYFETFSGLAEYLTHTRATAARLGYTTTHFGRRRFFPGIRSKIPYVRAMAERMAINAPLQGTQSDIIKIAMARIAKVLKEKFATDAAIVLQIHDELIFEVKESILTDVAKEIRHAMENVIPASEMKGIPILVSGEAGPNWGEMTELGV